jgi:hypothetical protein
MHLGARKAGYLGKATTCAMQAVYSIILGALVGVTVDLGIYNDNSADGSNMS